MLDDFDAADVVGIVGVVGLGEPGLVGRSEDGGVADSGR
jgi:hypothetical protein